MRKLFVIVAATAALTAAACNTVKGAGEDVSAVGTAVAKCADGQTC